MASGKIKATAELSLDTSTASAQASKLIADIEGKLKQLESTSSNLNIFKDLVRYIRGADDALTMMRTKNKNLFDDVFSGLDGTLKKRIQNLFDLDDTQLSILSRLLTQMNGFSVKTPISEIKNFAKSINQLNEQLTGENIFQNIDEAFSGEETTEAHLKKLTKMTSKFASNYRKTLQGVKDDFSFGILGEKARKTFEDDSEDLKEIENQINKYRTLQKQFEYLKKTKGKFDTRSIEKRTSDEQKKQIDSAVSQFENAEKIIQGFTERRQTNSEAYLEALAKQAVAASKLSSLYYSENLSEDAETYFYASDEKIQAAERAEKIVQQSFDKKSDPINNRIKNRIDDQIQRFYGERNDIRSSIRELIDDALTASDSETALPNPKNIQTATGDVVSNIGQKAITASQEVKAMTANLRNLYNIASKPLETEYSFAINGVDLNLKKGIDSRVPTQTIAEHLLSNLERGTIVKGHTHQGEAPDTNYMDFINVIDDYYSGIAPLSATLGNRGISTWDLSGIPYEDAMRAYQEIEKLTKDTGVGINAEKVNEIFEKINPEYSNVAKEWTPENFGNLAKYMQQIGDAADTSIAPLDRFKSIIQLFDEDIDFDKYQDLLNNFDVSKSKDIFNQIMQMENLNLKLSDVSSMSLEGFEKSVADRKESYSDLRKEAKLTYEDISKASSDYYDYYLHPKNRKENPEWNSFFKKYFHPQEQLQIDQLFSNVGDYRNLDSVIREISSFFGLTTDDMPEMPEELSSYYELLGKVQQTLGNKFNEKTLDSLINKLHKAKEEVQGMAEAGEISQEQLDDINKSYDFVEQNRDFLKQIAIQKAKLNRTKEDDRITDPKQLDSAIETRLKSLQKLKKIYEVNPSLLSEDYIKQQEDMTKRMQEKSEQLKQKKESDQDVEQMQQLNKENQALSEQVEILNKQNNEQKAKDKEKIQLLEKEKQSLRNEADSYEEAAQSAFNKQIALEQKLDDLQHENDLLKKQDKSSENISDVSNSVNTEISDMNALQNAVQGVTSAVQAKTSSFQAEQGAVSGAVSSEIGQLGNLSKKIQQASNESKQLEKIQKNLTPEQQTRKNFYESFLYNKKLDALDLLYEDGASGKTEEWYQSELQKIRKEAQQEANNKFEKASGWTHEDETHYQEQLAINEKINLYYAERQKIINSIVSLNAKYSKSKSGTVEQANAYENLQIEQERLRLLDEGVQKYRTHIKQSKIDKQNLTMFEGTRKGNINAEIYDAQRVDKKMQQEADMWRQYEQIRKEQIDNDYDKAIEENNKNQKAKQQKEIDSYYNYIERLNQAREQIRKDRKKQIDYDIKQQKQQGKQEEDMWEKYEENKKNIFNQDYDNAMQERNESEHKEQQKEVDSYYDYIDRLNQFREQNRKNRKREIELGWEEFDEEQKQMTEKQKIQEEIDKETERHAREVQQNEEREEETRNIDTRKEIEEWDKILQYEEKEQNKFQDAGKKSLYEQKISMAQSNLVASYKKLNDENKVSIADEYDEAIQKIGEYKAAIKDGTNFEQTEIDKITKSLQTKMDTMINDQKIRDAGKKNLYNQKISIAQSNLVASYKKLNDEDKVSIADEYDEAIKKIGEYKAAVKDGAEFEQTEIDKITKSLQAKMDTMINRQNVQKANQNFKSSDFEKFNLQYNSLFSQANSEQFKSSDIVKSAFNDYQFAYKKVLDLRQQILQQGYAMTPQQQATLDLDIKSMNSYKDILTKIIDQTHELKSKSVKSFNLGDNFENTESGRKHAFEDYLDTIDGLQKKTVQFSDSYRECMYQIKNSDGTITEMTAKFTKAGNSIETLPGKVKQTGSVFGNFIAEIGSKFKSIGSYLAASFGFEEVFQFIRNGVQDITEIDSALTELRKVTNGTDKEYGSFLKNMASTSSQIGATISDLTMMSAEWARLGYSMEDAGELAKNTGILLNVSEFKDAETASKALISTMQAFKYTAEDSSYVVDVLNEVGNNYAVSSDGIAVALQHSASALMSAGNNFEQSVALIAAANKVVQDPNSVGTALRTISLRLRGTSIDVLSEMGEETDGVVESTSKLQEKVKALSGVDILSDSGNYKDTYTILSEIGKVWQDMADVDQAALLELLAGKNRANTLSAILNNMTDLHSAYQTALNADGSAEKENLKFLNSIEGKVKKFDTSMQNMWMNTLNSSSIKGLVDFGTGLVKFVDKIGLVSSASGAFTALVSSAVSLKKSFQDEGQGIVSNKGLFGKLRNKYDKSKIQQKYDQEWEAQIDAVLSNKRTKNIIQDRADQIYKDLMKDASQSAVNQNSYWNDILGSTPEDEEYRKLQESAREEAERKAAAQYLRDKKSFTKRKKHNKQMQQGEIDLSDAIDSTTDSRKKSQKMMDKEDQAIERGIRKQARLTKMQKATTSVLNVGKSLLTGLATGLVTTGLSWALEKTINWIVKKANAGKERIQNAASESDSLQEKQRQLKQYQEQIHELRKSLDSGNLTDQQSFETRKKLLDIQSDLINNYGIEAKGINLVTGALKDQDNQIDNLLKDSSEYWLAANSQAYEDSKRTMTGRNDLSLKFKKDFKETNNYENKDGYNYDEKKKELDNLQYQFQDFYNDLANQISDGFFDEITDKTNIKFENSRITDFLNPKLTFSNVTIEEQLQLLDKLSEYIYTYSKQNGINLSDYLNQIQNIKNELNDEDFLLQKQVYNQGRLNQAVTQYADKYHNILTAQENFLNAKTDEERLTAIEAYKTAVTEAMKAATDDQPMYDFFQDMQNMFSQSEFEIKLKFNTNGLQTELSNLINNGGEKGLSAKDSNEILSLYEKYKSNGNSTEGITGYTEEQLKGIEQLSKYLDTYHITIDGLINALVMFGLINGSVVDEQIKSNEKKYKSYKDLQGSVQACESAEEELNKTNYNGAAISEDQYNNLKKLIGTEEEFAYAIDTSNGYVIKHSKLLTTLIQRKKQEALTDTILSKTQAELQYHKLTNELKNYIHEVEQSQKSEKDAIKYNKNYVDSLMEQINAVEQTISKYNELEDHLLGQSSKFTEFQQSKAYDNENTYAGQYSEMAQTLYNAYYKTGQVGTQAVSEAIQAIVPETVYSGLEKGSYLYNQAIHSWLNDNLQQMFTVQGEQLSITSRDIQNFVSKGLWTAKIFEGNEQNFDLVEGMNLEKAAELMGITKTAAYAMFAELEKYTGKNFLSLLDDSSTGKIHSLEADLAELIYQRDQLLKKEPDYQTNKELDEVNQKIEETSNAIEELINKVTNNARNYLEKSNLIDQLEELKKKGVSTVKDLDKETKTSIDHLFGKGFSEKFKSVQDLINGMRREISKMEPVDAFSAGLVIEENTRNLESLRAGLNTLLQNPSMGKITIPISGENIEFDQDGIESKIAELEGQNKELSIKFNIQLEGEEAEFDKDGTVKYSPDYSACEGSTPPPRYGVAYYRPVDLQTPGLGGMNVVDGTAHVDGTAYSNGNWGAKRTENSLVGELGQEIVVSNGRWRTVGDNGAEFTKIKKGDIVFNHKQTESLLKNGYVTGRGKAYAEGTAYAGYDGSLWMPTRPNGGSGGWSDDVDKASNDLAEEFKNIFDWIEVRIEEINEALDLFAEKLDNAVGFKAKNKILDEMIKTNQILKDNLLSGAKEYDAFSEKLLNLIPEKYREAAKNGQIAIETFKDETDKETFDNISKYRDWVQKGSDALKEAESVINEIAELAKQKFDNISDEFSSLIDVIESENSNLESEISYLEESGKEVSKEYYEQMMSNASKKEDALKKEKQELQKVLDEQIAAGNIKIGSEQWFDMVNDIHSVDNEIIETKSDLEDFQNSINEIYWTNFDNLINRLDYIQDETQSIIDLLSNKDLFDKLDLEDGWSDKDVKWTKEGLTALGLYAQQMELAEFKSKEYQKAINDLNQDYHDGKYSETEYLEKLNELKQSQYDSIEAYYDSREAIKDLNSERIEAVKNGINKEIEAYEKLINKQKESLNEEKEIYDFQKGIKEKEESISDLQRQLDAMSGDNSLEALAKKKQLQAELAEKEKDLEEEYYDRSFSDKQDALDKELESFQDEKNKEIENLEKYLEDIDLVVKDSLELVKKNTNTIYDEILNLSNEYGIQISDSVKLPWQSGDQAIDEYQEKFNSSMSSTIEQLNQIKNKWQEIINKMQEAAKIDIFNKNKENEKINQNIDDMHHYAKGIRSIPRNQIATIDELGEELVLHANNNGKLSYLSKGSSVIPSNLTNKLMQLTKINPQEILDRSRPSISAIPMNHNINNISISMDVAEVVHVDRVDQNNVQDLSNIVNKQLNSFMNELNNNIRKYSR